MCVCLCVSLCLCLRVHVRLRELWVCVRGCVNVYCIRVFVCVIVQMCKCVWLCECVSVWECLCVDLYMWESVSTCERVWYTHTHRAREKEFRERERVCMYCECVQVWVWMCDWENFVQAIKKVNGLQLKHIFLQKKEMKKTKWVNAS